MNFHDPSFGGGYIRLNMARIARSRITTDPFLLDCPRAVFNLFAGGGTWPRRGAALQSIYHFTAITNPTVRRFLKSHFIGPGRPV